jgi:hypothetical protein
MNKIYRNFQEIRANEDSRTISGYAVVFDSWSRDLGGFTEIIRQSAISQELLNESDVIANINHDDNMMVARCKEGEGTLRLSLDEHGLAFEFEAPETERGNQLLWDIRNGNLYECSFCFALPDNDTCQRWFRGEDGSLKREITQIGWLHDVSIVTVAAYPATSVDNREAIDIEAIKRSLDEADEEAKRAEEQARKDEIIATLDIRLNDFYKNISL